MIKIAIIFLAVTNSLFFSLNSCWPKEKPFDIRGFEIISENNIQANGDSVFYLNTFFRVYYYKDFIVYSYPYQFDSTDNGKVILDEQRIAYFILQKDSLYGYHFDTKPYHIMPNDARLPADSMRFRLNNANYDTFSLMKPDSSYVTEDKTLTEIYYHPKKQPGAVSFAYCFSFSKTFPQMGVTFGRKLENQKRMKLYKVKIYTSGGYSEEHKTKIPRMEVSMEIKVIPVENKDEIFSFIARYKKLSGLNGH
jgi:hypothetical protein